MADTSRLYTIEQVVQLAIATGDHNENKATRFLHIALRGLRKLRRNVIKEGVSFSKVTPNAINRVSFPQDMEEFIGIGVPVGGKLYLLTEDQDIIATYTESDEGVLSLDSEDGEGVALQTSQYPSFRATGGHNLYGYFKVDWENDVIIINATSRTELILAYTTSGINLAGATWVPTRAVDALMWYVLWQDIVTNPNVPESLVARFKTEFLQEQRQLKLNDMFSVQEFRDNWTRSNNLLRR